MIQTMTVVKAEMPACQRD